MELLDAPVSGGPAGEGDHFFDARWVQPSTGYSVTNVQIPHPGYYLGEHDQFGQLFAADHTLRGG